MPAIQIEDKVLAGEMSAAAAAAKARSWRAKMMSGPPGPKPGPSPGPTPTLFHSSLPALRQTSATTGYLRNNFGILIFLRCASSGVVGGRFLMCARDTFTDVAMSLPDISNIVPKQKPVKVADIIRAVCAATNTSSATIFSQRRNAEAVLPRQMVMALAFELTGSSLPAIGRALGGKDHTTVLHGVRKMAPLIAQVRASLPPDPLLGEWVAALWAAIKTVTREQWRKWAEDARKPRDEVAKAA